MIQILFFVQFIVHNEHNIFDIYGCVRSNRLENFRRFMKFEMIDHMLNFNNL